MAIQICNDKIVFGDYVFCQVSDGIYFSGELCADTFADTRPPGRYGTTFGLIVGGAPSVPTTSESITFASDSRSTEPSVTTSPGVYSAIGVGSGENAYLTGGRPGTVDCIRKTPFLRNASFSCIGALSTLSFYHGGNQSLENGYRAGGKNPPSTYSCIDKFPFSSDSSASCIGALTQGRYAIASSDSTTHGYSTGGLTPSLSNVIDKFPFASDSNATDVGDRSPQVGSRGFSFGFSAPACGYAAGADYPTVGCIEFFPFASDTNATCTGNLGPRYWGQGSTSVTHGYTHGGAPSSTSIISKFPFSTGVTASSVANLCSSRYGVAGNMQQ